MKKEITVEGVIVQRWTPLKLTKENIKFSISSPSGLPQVEKYQEAVKAAIDKTGFAKLINSKTCTLFIDELNYSVDIPLSWLTLNKENMMKTKLPLYIKTVDEAKTFLSELYKNSESYHPEDSAADIVNRNDKLLFNKYEAIQLDKLMSDIYKLKGNESHLNMIFDPCAYLLFCDPEYKARVAFDIFVEIEGTGAVINTLQAMSVSQDIERMKNYLTNIAVSVRADLCSSAWKKILGEQGYDLIQDVIKYEL